MTSIHPVLRLSSLCLGLAMLAACGGGPNPGASQAPSSPQVQPGGGSPPPSLPPAPASGAASAKPAASGAASAKPAASGSAAASGAPSGSPAASGAALQHIGGTVAVVASWGGDEQASFMAELQPFEQQTGIQVQYTGTRDLNSVLTTRVQAGNPPEVAALPNPGAMAQFAQSGKLLDLSNVVDVNQMKAQYAPDWLTLGTVNNKLVGVFVKADLKSTIWYDPKTFDQVSGGSAPSTWTDLMNLSNKIAGTGTAPWCIGLESAATSGWPGTDWLSDIMMRSAGPQAYQQWYNGQLSWTSNEVKNAWQMWGQIVGNPKMVYGGVQSMLSTNFANAGTPMFKSPPGCYMERQGDFITANYTSNNPGIKAGTDFNYFPFPSINSQYQGVAQVSGDMVGMFKDTPQARALIQYLTTPQAQAIWVKRGGALSPNKQVPASDYPDQLSQKLAQTLTSAQTPLFSAGDMMPNAMQSAFYKAVLSYVQNPNQLDSILSGLDQTRATTYASSGASAKPSAS